MKTKILNQLEKLGIQKGDVLLVHSSMKAINTTLTPVEIIQLLQEAVGAEGTLLIPALTYENVTSKTPYFNSISSIPCIGLLPRTFLNMDHVVRSLHPTHSVCAWGKYARDLTCDHIYDQTPVGENSPFRKLVQYNGKLLFIGETLNCCTFMHGIEEIAKTDYVLTKHFISYVLNETKKDYYGHAFDRIETHYEKIKDLPNLNSLKIGLIGDAKSYLMDSSELKEITLDLLKQNQDYFITRLS